MAINHKNNVKNTGKSIKAKVSWTERRPGARIATKQQPMSGSERPA